jgi:hypothetical protein
MDNSKRMNRILYNEIMAVYANPDMPDEELKRNVYIKDKLSALTWIQRIKEKNPMNCGHGKLAFECTLC